MCAAYVHLGMLDMSRVPVPSVDWVPDGAKALAVDAPPPTAYARHLFTIRALSSRASALALSSAYTAATASSMRVDALSPRVSGAIANRRSAHIN